MEGRVGLEENFLYSLEYVITLATEASPECVHGIFSESCTNERIDREAVQCALEKGLELVHDVSHCVGVWVADVLWLAHCFKEFAQYLICVVWHKA